jgi:hypothetical protein
MRLVKPLPVPRVRYMAAKLAISLGSRGDALFGFAAHL